MIPKFRAWDKKYRKIIIADDILDLNLERNEIEYQEVYQYGSNPPERDICAGKLTEFVLMQSTGLKDKNGVEIYEGDIVSTIHGLCEVKYIKDSYHIVKGNRSSLLSWQDVNVVGNIYENPELLEE